MRVRPGALVALALAALAAVGLLASTDDEHGDGRRFEAEFETVRGLVERNDVRMFGAPAGTVEQIELTDRGTARVTVELDDDVPAPRTDTALTVRPVDLLGDYYLSYSPGQSRRPLAGRVPLSRTSKVTEIPDLLRALTPRARAGLRALLVELGIGLERRGVDLNRAVVELRPALAATDRMMAELASQNANLRALIDDSGRFAGQAAARADDVERMLASFAATLRETAAHAPALDRGLARLHPTFSQLRGTTTRLARTAADLRPLSGQLLRAAPGLAEAMRELRPFLGEARRAVVATRPTLRRTRGLLRSGAPTLRRLATGLGSLHGIAPELDSFTRTLVPLTDQTSDALFDKVASQASEPGDQPLDPGTDPLRRLWRGAAVLTCESFGLPIRPGCLGELLRSSAPTGARAERRADGRRPSQRTAQPQPARRPTSPFLDLLLGR